MLAVCHWGQPTVPATWVPHTMEEHERALEAARMESQRRQQALDRTSLAGHAVRGRQDPPDGDHNPYIAAVAGAHIGPAAKNGDNLFIANVPCGAGQSQQAVVRVVPAAGSAAAKLRRERASSTSHPTSTAGPGGRYARQVKRRPHTAGRLRTRSAQLGANLHSVSGGGGRDYSRHTARQASSNSDRNNASQTPSHRRRRRRSGPAVPLHAHKARAASGSGLGAVRWIPDPRRLGGAVRDQRMRLVQPSYPPKNYQRMRLGTAATKNSPLPNAVLDQADFKFQVPL